MASIIQRIENAAIAVAIFCLVFSLGLTWWVLFAAFLLFDLSMLGYTANTRLGNFTYNLVHNYTGPALLIIIYTGFQLLEIPSKGIALAAACWGFHVAVDRALGYGLKLSNFNDTHLGNIGKTE